jgi:hypothetical protein
MKFNQGALMKAAGIGVALGVITGVTSNVPVVACACCAIGWALWFAAGASYGYFDQGEGNPADMGSWALGGAIAGGIGGIVRAIVGGIVQIIMVATGMAATSTVQSLEQLRQFGVDIPPEVIEQMGSTAAAGAGNVAAMIPGILIGACVGLILYAIFGALGGVIYAAIRGNRQPQPPLMPQV